MGILRGGTSGAGDRAGFGIGDIVESVAIGSCAAFRGEIIEVLRTGVGDRYFHVIDARGAVWHRAADDIRLITGAVRP